MTARPKRIPSYGSCGEPMEPEVELSRTTRWFNALLGAAIALVVALMVMLMWLMFDMLRVLKAL